MHAPTMQLNRAPVQIVGLTDAIPGFHFNGIQYQIKNGALCNVTNDLVMYRDGEVLRFAIVQATPDVQPVYFVLNVRLSYTNVRLLIFNSDFQLLQSLRSHHVDFIHFMANQLITCDRISIDFYKHTTEGFKFSNSKIHYGLNICIVYRGYYISYDCSFITAYDQNFKPYKNIIHAGILQYMAESPDGNLHVQFKDCLVIIDSDFNRIA